MKIISLGWGVQSFTLAAMVALGELEPVDAVIHADTLHERSATYEFSKKWTPWLEERGVKVVTVCDEIAARRIEQGEMIPAFTVNSENGKTGQAFRTCTQRWKIAPMRRWLQDNRDGSQVEQWLGITTDEIERMTNSNVNYIVNRYPLIERRMSRDACIAWLVRHNLEVPIKSACVFCPYHSKSAWFDIKDTGGTDWEQAIAIDSKIRKARPPYDLFVYSGMIPLSEISTPHDNGQLDMFQSDECSGVCFV